MLILIGLFTLAAGTLMVIFRRNIYNFTGQLDFVESWFPGGTHTFLIFFGLGMILLGILFITGIGSSITDPISNQLKGTFGSLK